MNFLSLEQMMIIIQSVRCRLEMSSAYGLQIRHCLLHNSMRKVKTKKLQNEFKYFIL